jgi:hypothetical protein
MKSLFLSLNLNDLLKGMIVAAFTAIGMAIIPALEAGALPTMAMLGSAGIAGLAAGLAYLLKNFLSNSNNQPFKSEKDVVATTVVVPVEAMPAVKEAIAAVKETPK